MAFLTASMAFVLAFFKSTSLLTDAIKTLVLFVVVFLLAWLFKEWLESLNDFIFAAIVGAFAVLLDLFHRVSLAFPK